MYWVLMAEAKDENEAVLYETPTIIEDYDISFDDGEKLQSDIPRIDLHIADDEQGVLTDNLIAMGIRGLAFNSKVISLLKSLELSNIDFYKLRLINDESNEINDDYQIANIVGVVDCIDRDLSKLVINEATNNIRFIDKLVLDNMKIDESGLLIFRSKGFLPIVVVHDQIKALFENNNVSGVNFYKPDEFVL